MLDEPDLPEWRAFRAALPRLADNATKHTSRTGEIHEGAHYDLCRRCRVDTYDRVPPLRMIQWLESARYEIAALRLMLHERELLDRILNEGEQTPESEDVPSAEELLPDRNPAQVENHHFEPGERHPGPDLFTPGDGDWIACGHTRDGHVCGLSLEHELHWMDK